MNEQTINLTQSSQSVSNCFGLEDRLPKTTNRQRRVVPLSFQLAGFGLNLVSRLNNEWVAETLSNLWFTVFRKTTKPWVTAFWQQAEQSIEVVVGDKTIPVHLWGTGPLVVMMHGWSGSGTQYRRFIPSLVEAGYQVALFDAPAHGSNPGKRSDLAEFSDTLIAIQQQIGPVDSVIAHSLGAMAATFAIRRGFLVNHMVLIAPHLDVDTMFDSYSSLLKLNKTLASRFHHKVGSKMAHIIACEDPWKTLTPESLLPVGAIPGLLVYDDADEEIPQQLFEEIELHWEQGRALKTSGLGHNQLLKDERVIRQVVGYLTQSRAQ
jgi:pimeloyl-ACP methyl ester carboxylesterase